MLQNKMYIKSVKFTIQSCIYVRTYVAVIQFKQTRQFTNSVWRRYVHSSNKGFFVGGMVL